MTEMDNYLRWYDETDFGTEIKRYGPGNTNAEGYLTNPSDAETWSRSGEFHCIYPAHRSTLMSKLEAGLPNLREFGFGRGNWEGGKNFDGAELVRTGPRDLRERYETFNGHCGRCSWLRVDEFMRIRDMFKNDWKVEPEPEPVDLAFELRKRMKLLIRN